VPTNPEGRSATHARGKSFKKESKSAGMPFQGNAKRKLAHISLWDC
jgi:hypothetical protein